MSMSGFNWMSILRILWNGVLLPMRPKLNFIGAVTVTDDELNSQTIVNVGGQGGNVSLTGTALTSDATVTQIVDIAIPTDYTGMLTLELSAQQTDGTKRYGEFAIVLVRNVGGVVSPVADVTKLDPDLVPWSTGVTVLPNLLRINVIGAVGDTIRWNILVAGSLNPGNA